MNTLIRSYAFKDVAIVQKENICASRLDAKIEGEIIRGIRRPIPLIASNMSDVVNADFCIELYKLGSLGFMHRAFPNTDDYIEEVKKIAMECPVVAVSVGIKPQDYILVKQLVEAGANCVVVDIANGFCKPCLNMCEYIKEAYPTVRIVAGNNINPDMFKMFCHCVDAIKIGIGRGSACATANTAGSTKNQFSAIYDLKEISIKYGIPIISDGSIKEPSDFCKAIGAGASSAMAGSIFARCPESASIKVDVDGVKKCVYSGMASINVQNRWKNGVKPNTCAEGKTLFLNIGESVENLLERYSGALRSGISYAGFNNIEDFKKGCEFILI